MLKEETSARDTQGGARISTHDQPIILDNGSVDMGLDGDRGRSYDRLGPGRYQARHHKIRSVTVDGTPCEGVPSNGRCTIEIGGRDTGGGNSPIRIVGHAGGIDINFDEGHYPRTSGDEDNRKLHRSGNHRVHSLTITPEGGTPHPCTLPSPQTRFRIRVDDMGHV